ncbi:MAG: DUF4157 domain-containing protein [Proteobacteria bacterium]|nr:DUF4157 domain-containing protein [Pseudomonadota bacterium]
MGQTTVTGLVEDWSRVAFRPDLYSTPTIQMAQVLRTDEATPIATATQAAAAPDVQQELAPGGKTDFDKPIHRKVSQAGAATREESVVGLARPDSRLTAEWEKVAFRPDLYAEQGSDPLRLFDRATQGSAGEVPYRSEMEAAFDRDFSQVRAYTGQAQPLAHLSADAAAVGARMAFASHHPERELVAHELTHVVQQEAQEPALAASGLSDPDSPLEQEADAVAREVSAGRPAPPIRAAASGVVHRHGLRQGRPSSSASEVPDHGEPGQNAAFPPGFDPETKARQLHQAMDGWGTDERTILDILWTGRQDMTRAIEQAYNRAYSPPLETALHDELSGSELKRALTILGHGEMTLRDKLREAAEGWGTDDDQIFNSLDRASPAELAELRNDAELLAHVRDDLSGADLELFNAYVSGHGALAGKLRQAVDGWGTDEAAIWRALEGASEAEKNFVLARPGLMAEIQSDLDAELSLRFERMLRGTLSNLDRIDIAMAGWGTDEAGLEAALTGLKAEEFTRLPADIDSQLLGELSGETAARCREILHQKRLSFDSGYREKYLARQADELGQNAMEDAGRSVLVAGENQSQSAVGRLKTACAGAGTNDREIWTVLNSLSNAERAFIRERNPEGVLEALRGDLSDGDYRRAMTILGGGGAAAVATLRQAVEGWGTDERLIYDGIGRIIDQGMGAHVLADTGLMAHLAEDISIIQYQILRHSLASGDFTPIARLRWATAMAGTDEELVFELCGAHAAQWYTGGAMAAEVDEILKRELNTRDYWKALDIMRGEPRTEAERLARSKELLERERGGVSTSIMDSLSSSGENADDAWREYQATYNRAMADGHVSKDEQQLLRRDQEYSNRMTSEYREAKASVAQWATTIAVAIVGIAATILTAGAAGPFVAALAAKLGGSVAVCAEAMVLAAALKVGLNRAIQGEGYDVTSTQALVDAVSASVEVGLNMAGGAVASKFMQGLSRTAIARSVGPSVQRVFGNAGQRILAQGLESTVDGAIGGVGEGVIQAIGNEATWQGEIEDVLGNIGTTVGVTTLMSAGGGFIAGSGLRSIGEVIGPRLRGKVPEQTVTDASLAGGTKNADELATAGAKHADQQSSVNTRNADELVASGDGALRPTGAGFARVSDPAAAAEYVKISRWTAEQIDEAASNLGVSSDVFKEAHAHMMLRSHDIVIDGTIVRAQFEPDMTLADYWNAALSGKWDPDNFTSQQDVRWFVAHEYMESRIMKLKDVPYQRIDEWKLIDGEWEYRPDTSNYGAHAASSLHDGTFRHWSTVIGREYSGPSLSPDLSNIDEVVDYIAKAAF